MSFKPTLPHRSSEDKSQDGAQDSPPARKANLDQSWLTRDGSNISSSPAFSLQEIGGKVGSKSQSKNYFFWDTLCCATIAGIWPRFIEPKLLQTTQLAVPFPLPKETPTLKIVQLSDLHINRLVPESFLDRILTKIAEQKPDLIVCTGDFICNSELDDKQKILRFLRRLKAPRGIFAVLGNHDFEKSLTVNKDGDYDVEENRSSPFLKGLKRFFFPPVFSKKVTHSAFSLKPHSELLELLQEASIQLLNNRTIKLEGLLNITGVGEHMTGQVKPELAFQNYDQSLPGIVLAHNPDAFPLLTNFPGSLVLSGHTHGGQINLPGLWQRFSALENPCYKKGLFKEKEKTLFVSRGLGGVIPFRLNSIPEVVAITLIKA